MITQANEIASKASFSGGYKWPLIRDEPPVFIERDRQNIALINFLAEARLRVVFKRPFVPATVGGTNGNLQELKDFKRRYEQCLLMPN